MQPFMDENFLLKTPTAVKLFHETAKDLPIFDYHCHLNPQEIFEDKHYNNLTELWLYGDHYKWRFMRSMGVEEKYITGGADDYQKFLAYVKAVQFAIGNPLYHWSHLELRRYFGIEDILTEDNAKSIYDRANEVIRQPDFSVRSLIARSNVAFIGTTDDPCDSLEYHKALQADASFQTKVCPTFRPDKAVQIANSGFADYIRRLATVCRMSINGIDDLCRALANRMDYFEQAGCHVSDHSFGWMPYAEATKEEVDVIFRRVLAGGRVDAQQAEQYMYYVMSALGEQFGKRGWVMQLHLGALRNNNTQMLRQLGPDTGFDSIDDNQLAAKLSRFMDGLNQKGCLPKTVLYTLNPKDNYVLGSMAGNFQQGGIRGKIQFGSAWWFNDHIDGMTEQMRTLANVGALAAFVGMLTDSRSFLSYPRHEYFRRIVCNLIGQWVEDGEFPDQPELLTSIVKGICYDNAKHYFTK